jgi:hypothetical protein
MSANASPRTIVQRAGAVLGLLMLAGGLMADTPVSSQTVYLPQQAESSPAELRPQFSPADEQGRYTYLIDFAEPSVIEQHRSNAAGEFRRGAPGNSAWRSQLQSLQAQRIDQMAQKLGRSVSPSHYFLDLRNGIAVNLTAAEAKRIESMEGVKSIERERVYSLDTFRGPDFIGAPAIWDGSATPDGSPLTGEGMVAAILDSGIPPIPATHPSFVNDPACGHGVGDVPAKVISALDCGSTDADGLCNGADPVDENGHGTHVASTVAGNRVTNSATPSPEVPAPFDAISGVAYCAHIRSYDVCNADGPTGIPGQSCAGADIVAGLESVIIHTDSGVIGAIPPVTAMNFSIGGGDSPWADADRFMLDLLDAGVLSSASAGNGGPTPGDVGHLGPWVMTVASSTHDGRIFDAGVSLDGGPQDVAALEGTGLELESVYTGQLRWAGDVDAANNLGCDPFPADSFDGEAALIERGGCPFEAKVNNATGAGANFVIVFTDDRDVTSMNVGSATSVSSFMINRQAGLDMVSALAGGTAEVTVDPTPVGVIDPDAGDILSGFSSRGPTSAPLQDLQKPNITAPGDLIYAADLNRDTGEFGYGTKGGTSMSSPHVAGSAVLVRQANPDWTVAETKSALQLTASRDGLKDDGSTPWDWDDVGNGRVDLNNAALAGFVMDETFANYLAADPGAGGDVKTLNSPDIRNVNCTPNCSFTRTIRNTYEVATDWTVTVENFGSNVDIQVTPASFSFTGDVAETQELTIDVTPTASTNGEIEFGIIRFDEDNDQAPQAHFTTAISGSPSLPAEAAVDETDFTLLLEEGESGSASFNISNVAEGPAIDDLTYSIDEASPTTVVLSANREASPPQPIELAADGFSGSFSGIGVGEAQFLWFNQLTPGPTDLPFDLEAVALIDGATATNFVQDGDLYDIYVWSDPDRIPGNGDEVLLSQVNGETHGAAPAFGAIPLPAPVPITEATGDVLIGVVNRTVRPEYFPANGESGSAYQDRAWIAFNFPGGVVADPPVFADAGTFNTIGGLNPALARNWVIRGLGTGGSACLTPSDVPWLTVTPTSGAVAQGESEEVVIDVDTAGLAPGSYEARVCVNTSDPNNPIFILPVNVEVTEVGGLPTVDVAPGTVDTTVDVLDPTGSETIDISNTGTDLDLEWSIETAEPVAGARGGSIVEFDNIDYQVPDDFDGGTITWETGDAVDGFVPGGGGANLNPYGSSGDLAFFWYEDVDAGGGGVASDGTVHDVLQPGDVIGPGSNFISPTGAAALADFQSGVSGYLGFRFDNAGTTNYGYALIETTGPTGFPAFFRSWAFDSSGAPITIPEDGPAPSACEDPSDIDWLSVTPSSGTTAAGDTDSVTVDFDATGLTPGLYEAVLCINSNDPATPQVEVPVSMDVAVPANAAEVTGVVQGLGYCQADPILAAGAGIEIVGSIETVNVTADANGEYFAFLDTANGPVDVTATAPDHITQTQTGVALVGAGSTTVDFGLVLELPCAEVTPTEFSDVFAPSGPTTGSYSMTVDNSLGGALLEWGIQEASPDAVEYVYGLPGGGEVVSNPGGVRGDDTIAAERPLDASPFVDPAPQGAPILNSFEESFDDITTLPGAGWALQNLSEPLGVTDWFQGNPDNFEAHEGAPDAYISANFNSTAGGDGVISNWLMTPEVELFNGTELSFWTRVPSNAFPDRLEVRLSTSGASTFAGASATEVGDFDTVLLTIDENLEGTYPTEWTEFTATVIGLDEPTSGRLAFRYFVTEAGPAGVNSNLIGIDTVSVTQPACAAPVDIPWLSFTPFFGSAGVGETDAVSVDVDTAGLDAGSYEAFICVRTNDERTPLIEIPFSIEVLGDGIFEDRFEG